VRNRLLKSGAKLRTRWEGTEIFYRRHPEHYDRLIKWKVRDFGHITDAKLLLMAMIITEGCICRHTIHFTNTQEMLHERFKQLIHEAYGDVRVGRNGLNSRISSTQIIKELSPHIAGKVFAGSILSRILSSHNLAIRVAKIIADTEGSMIISIRRAPRNYTVEFRVVLACTNSAFSVQIKAILGSLGIESRINRVGVHILSHDNIKRFVELVGFTPGIKVVRKKAGVAVWYGHDKNTMSRIFLRVSEEQKRVWGNPARGLFASCKTREKTVERLMSLYREANVG